MGGKQRADATRIRLSLARVLGTERGPAGGSDTKTLTSNCMHSFANPETLRYPCTEITQSHPFCKFRLIQKISQKYSGNDCIAAIENALF